MTGKNSINPDLLTVYASLAFVIGALITLAASVVTYRNGLNNTSGVQNVTIGALAGRVR